MGDDAYLRATQAALVVLDKCLSTIKEQTTLANAACFHFAVRLRRLLPDCRHDNFWIDMTTTDLSGVVEYNRLYLFVLLLCNTDLNSPFDDTREVRNKLIEMYFYGDNARICQVLPADKCTEVPNFTERQKFHLNQFVSEANLRIDAHNQKYTTPCFPQAVAMPAFEWFLGGNLKDPFGKQGPSVFVGDHFVSLNQSSVNLPDEENVNWDVYEETCGTVAPTRLRRRKNHLQNDPENPFQLSSKPDIRLELEPSLAKIKCTSIPGAKAGRPNSEMFTIVMNLAISQGVLTANATNGEFAQMLCLCRALPKPVQNDLQTFLKWIDTDPVLFGKCPVKHKRVAFLVEEQHRQFEKSRAKALEKQYGHVGSLLPLSH